MTDAEIAALAAKFSQRAVARRLNVSLGKVQRAIARHNKRIQINGRGEPVEPPKPTRVLVEEGRERQHLRDENRRLRAQIAEIHRDDINAADVREKIFGLAARTPEPPEWTIQHKPGSGLAGIPTAPWSDWHVGETVAAAEVNGVNSFSLAIAETRIRRLVERTIDLCRQHMSGGEVPGIIVPLLGDMVTGEIHDELAQTNDIDLLPAIPWTADRIIWGLERLADEFGRVHCPCASGNHGRNTKRLQAKRFAYKNFDWLIYCIVERHFRNDPRVTFDIPETGEPQWQLYGVRYLGIHGHDIGVKGGDGIIGAIGPIMRGSLKVSHSQAQIGRDFDILVMGHWHQMLWLPRVIVNNSLKGYDEFARAFLRASFSRPSQALWFTHPKHGITARWEIFLEDRPAAIKSKTPDWLEAA